MVNAERKGNRRATMGRRLAAQRVLLGLSQGQVAEQTGFSQAYLSQLENDRTVSPPLSTVAKLAALYGVTLDYLANGGMA